MENGQDRNEHRLGDQDLVQVNGGAGGRNKGETKEPTANEPIATVDMMCPICQKMRTVDIYSGSRGIARVCLHKFMA
ncbi:MAG: hypothetical protein K6G16_04130 [Lachnospiraceae bacterium]|nr:hypothetical protein [Lachnospiraceae bacterium]